MKTQTFSDQVREIIRKSGRTHRSIAKEMGVAPSVVHRFMHGSGMSTSSVDRLARVLGLRVIVAKRQGEEG
jgi:hypothetical protein